MSDDQSPTAPQKSATQTLAELVARRKAAAGQAGPGPPQGSRRAAERAAAAHSASKSKPALRK